MVRVTAFPFPHPFALTAIAIVLSGCTEQTPVDEVSIQASGIRVTEAASKTSSDDWPGWRGPNHNGIAPDQELVTSWSDADNIVWRADVAGRGHSSPIVVGDHICLATALEDEKQQLIVGHSRLNGKEVWRTVIHEGGFPSSGSMHQKSTHANGTVASDGERLFIAFLNSGRIKVTALDLSGDQIWQRDIGAFNSKFGYAPSPILYKSFVIVAADNQGGGYIAALDTASGEIAWRIARPAISTYSSPTVATIGGRDQLLISGCRAVSSFDPATGKTLWNTPCGSEATCGTIVTSPESIFSSGGYPEVETVCLTAEGDVVWTTRAKLYEPSMIYHDGNLFGITDDGIAHCWDAESGDVRWRERLNAQFSASPVLCNGLIYAPDLSGNTTVFAATSSGFREHSSNRLGSDCYASPAVSGGQIFLRIGQGGGPGRREQLVCIGRPPETT